MRILLIPCVLSRRLKYLRKSQSAIVEMAVFGHITLSPLDIVQNETKDSDTRISYGIPPRADNFEGMNQ